MFSKGISFSNILGDVGSLYFLKYISLTFCAYIVQIAILSSNSYF